jgi:REP element-mobilizing transposase RayT
MNYQVPIQDTARTDGRACARPASTELRKRYWGQHLWARGYFCASVDAVDEDTIKKYIESQKWDDEDQGFKITAPTEP